MATREEKIKLDVTGADQSVRDLEKVGGTAKRTGDSVKGMGQEATQASKRIDDLGDEAKQTAGQLNKLEREVLEAKAALKALGDEYARTTDPKIGAELDKQASALAKLEARARGIAKVNKDIGGGPAKAVDPVKAIQAQIVEMDRAANVRKRIASDEESAYREAEQRTKRSLADAYQRRRDGRGVVGNTFADLFGIGKSIIGKSTAGATQAATDLNEVTSKVPGGTLAKVALGAGAAPGLGALGGGAVLAGGALAGVGAGVAGAVAGDPARFKAEWGDAIGGIAARWKEVSARDFSAPLSESIKLVKRELNDLDIAKPLQSASKYLVPLTQGVTGFIGPLLKGVDSLVEKAGPVVAVLEKDLPLLGKAFEQAFGDIGDGASGAASALDDVIQVTGTAVIAIGMFVKGASQLYDWAQKTIPLMGDQNANTLSYARTLDGATASTHTYVDVQKLLADAANAAADAQRKEFGVMLSAGEAADAATVATQKLNETLKENGYTIEGNGKKALENRDVIRQSIRAWEEDAEAAEAAAGNTTESIAEANGALLKHLEDLRAILRAHGQNTAEVDAYIAKLKEAMGLKLRDQSITIHVNYDTNGLPRNLGSRYGGTDQYASGGDVRRTGVALVGEHGPELRMLSRGDHILNASDTARVRASGSASVASGGGRGGTSLPPMSVIEQALAAVLMRLAQDGQLRLPSTAID